MSKPLLSAPIMAMVSNEPPSVSAEFAHTPIRSSVWMCWASCRGGIAIFRLPLGIDLGGSWLGGFGRGDDGGGKCERCSKQGGG